MKSAGLAFFTDVHWTLLGLLLFFSAFFILLIIHFKIYPKENAERMAQLPFDGDSHES